jgi:DNA-binding protein YbaB
MSRASRERWATSFDRYDRTLQTFERGLAQVKAVSEKSDGGAVTVEVDARGKVTRVHVEGDWERECSPGELGSTVLATIGRATARQLGDWAQAAAPEVPEPVSSRPIPEPDYHLPALRGPAGDSVVPDAVRQVGGLQGAVRELIDEMKSVAAAQHRGRSTEGHATATANGRSEIVGLEFDEDWLTHAHSFNIGREATAAITEAMRRGAAVSLDQVFTESRLGRLQGLLAQRNGPSASIDPFTDRDDRMTP